MKRARARVARAMIMVIRVAGKEEGKGSKATGWPVSQQQRR
jgi:hypothetical protein